MGEKHLWELMTNIVYPKRPLKYHKFRGLFQYSNNVIYYTCYPLGLRKRVNKIKVLSYDGDKYCTVQVLENNVISEIKTGYISTDRLSFQ